MIFSKHPSFEKRARCFDFATRQNGLMPALPCRWEPVWRKDVSCTFLRLGSFDVDRTLMRLLYRSKNGSKFLVGTWLIKSA